MNFLKGEFFKCCGQALDLPKAELPEVAFVGRSNVGKSSIINRIFNLKHIAKTSSTPGKTATINFYVAGNGFLVDLPGYGYAKISKLEKQRWANLTHSYYFGARLICLTIVVIDCRRGASDFDRKMISFLSEIKINFIIIMSKIDKLKTGALAKAYENLKLEFENCKILKFSAKTMEGLEELKQTILNYVKKTDGG